MRRLKTISLSKWFLLLSFLILLGYVTFVTSHHIVKTNYSKNTSCVSGILIKKENKEYAVSFELKAKEKMVGTIKDLPYEVGDSIKVCGELSYPNTNTNFHLFSYRNYLLSRKIVWQIKAETVSRIKTEASSFYTFKKRIDSFLSQYRSSSYLKTFLLGDQTEMKEEVKEAYQSLGVSHLFSISGMHVGFLSGVFLVFFKMTGRKKIPYIITSIFLFFYAFLVATPSIFRASIFFFFTSMKKCFSWEYPNHVALYYLAFMFLLWNPYYIYHTGFLYSFSISFYLLYFSEYIKKERCYWKKIGMISTISFLIGIPISLITNYEIVPTSILFNFLFVPLITFFFFPFTFILLIIPWFDPIYLFCIEQLETIALFLKSYTYPIVLGYPGIFMILYVVTSFYAIKGIVFKRKTYFIPLFLIVVIHFCFPYCNSNFQFTMLDVGQGNAMLIELPYRKGVIMIDTGGKKTNDSYNYPISKTVLIPYLKMKGIRKVDALILSHGGV